MKRILPLFLMLLAFTATAAERYLPLVYAETTLAPYPTNFFRANTNELFLLMDLFFDAVGGTPDDDSVTSAKIVNGAILNEDINASAAIDATKIADGSVSSEEFQRLDGLSDDLTTLLAAKITAAGGSGTGNTFTTPTLTDGAGLILDVQTAADVGTYFQISTNVTGGEVPAFRGLHITTGGTIPIAPRLTDVDSSSLQLVLQGDYDFGASFLGQDNGGHAGFFHFPVFTNTTYVAGWHMSPLSYLSNYGFRFVFGTNMVTAGSSIALDENDVLSGKDSTAMFTLNTTGGFTGAGNDFRIDALDYSATTGQQFIRQLMNSGVYSVSLRTNNGTSDKQRGLDITFNSPGVSNSFQIILDSARTDIMGGPLYVQNDLSIDGGDLVTQSGNLNIQPTGGTTTVTGALTLTGDLAVNGDDITSDGAALTLTATAVAVGNGATSAGVLRLNEDTDAGSNYASFQVPSLAANTVYVLPADDGDASQFLQTDGSGNLDWVTIGGGGDALVANPLSQFAATTSSQLRGVLSDENGTGAFLTDTGSAANLTSFPTLNQNTTGSAATLTTSRNLWGVAFNGSANIGGNIELGTAGTTDTTLARSGAGDATLEGNAIYRAGGTDIPVADGGTGRSTSTTAYGLIAAGTTATGAHQTLAAGATTEVLVGGGASALPVWTTATGSGAPVRATSPTLVTPALGAATATSVNGLTVTTTSGGVLTIPNSVTLTGPAASGTAMTLGNTETVTGAKTFSGALTYSGSAKRTVYATESGAAVGAAVTIDFDNGPIQSVLLDVNTTVTFADAPTTGSAWSGAIQFIQDGSGGNSVSLEGTPDYFDESGNPITTFSVDTTADAYTWITYLTVDGGVTYTVSQPGSSTTDSDAIHVDVANEITGITLKATPVANDEIVIEDSAASYVKKSATVGTLPISTATQTALDAKANLAGGNTFTGTQVFPSGQALIAPALGTIASGVGTALTALNGENIQNDTIDDDSIDFGTSTDQVSAADIPIADAGALITATEVEAALQEVVTHTRTESETFTIAEPDLVRGVTDDILLKKFPAEKYPNGVTITSIHIDASAAYTSETFLFQHWDDAAGSTQTTVESITASAISTEDDGTLSDATIPADFFFVLNFDDTPENVAYVAITVTWTY